MKKGRSDFALMKGFVEAVAFGDPGKVLSGPDTSLETHLTVFAAEKARRPGRVEDEIGRVRLGTVLGAASIQKVEPALPRLPRPLRSRFFGFRGC